MTDEASKDLYVKTYSREPLAPEELARVRRLLDADDKASWFCAMFRRWVLWLGGISVAVISSYDFLVKVVRGLAK